jgi:hypothetical protein
MESNILFSNSQMDRSAQFEKNITHILHGTASKMICFSKNETYFAKQLD